jgi:hypothetical protein
MVVLNYCSRAVFVWCGAWENIVLTFFWSTRLTAYVRAGRRIGITRSPLTTLAARSIRPH